MYAAVRACFLVHSGIRYILLATFFTCSKNYQQLGLGRLCSHFCPLFYSFIPINFTYYSFQCTYYSQLCQLDFTPNCAYNNLKVVTIRIFAFLSGFILALLKPTCSPLKKILTVNIRNVARNEATVHLVERDRKFAMF